jgi:hypothetical protein
MDQLVHLVIVVAELLILREGLFQSSLEKI